MGGHERVPTAAHLRSWAGGRCRRNNVTGGKRRSAKTNRGQTVWLGDILSECAWSASRTRDTYLAAQYWRLSRRIGQEEGRGRRWALHPRHLLHLLPTTSTTTTSAATTSPGVLHCRHQDRLCNSSKISATGSASRRSLRERHLANSSLILLTGSLRGPRPATAVPVKPSRGPSNAILAICTWRCITHTQRAESV